MPTPNWGPQAGVEMDDATFDAYLMANPPPGQTTHVSGSSVGAPGPAGAAAPPPGFDPNTPIPEAEWSNPNSRYFTDTSLNPGASNWRFNAGTGQWEVGNANMDLSNAVTGTLAPGSTAFVSDADPGASINTGQADDDRARMGGYLAQLTNQATTGGGAWEQALAQNTHATQQSAQALGQTAGLDPMNAAANIGNAQAGAAQRAVGQGNLLRAQTQQNAMGQLAGVLGGQGVLDAQQAAGQGAAREGVTATNALAKQRGEKGVKDTLVAGGNMMMTAAGMSEGGEVPGKPKVFGDDHRNDTVPAMLSPDEIVIPISITSRPDAPAAAARFVAAVQARGATQGQTNFAPGGAVPTFGNVDAAPESVSLGYLAPGEAPSGKQAPTIASGGLLDTKPYNATRTAGVANQGNLLASFLGTGPSTAPQAMQNATDTTIADSMRAQAGARRPLDATGAATEQSQGAAGNAAGIVAGESQRAGEVFAEAVHKQRAQDLAFATAQQQAAWRNTMMNAGISLEQQNQLKGLLGSAGQGAVAASSLFDRDRGGRGYDSGDMSLSGGKIYDDDMGKAHGGVIGYAEGGVVENHLARRQGTRRAGVRHETTPEMSERRREATGKRLRDRVTPPVVDSSWQGVREQRGGTQYEDDLMFAEGGVVPKNWLQRLLAGAAGDTASPVNFDGVGVGSQNTTGPFQELPPPRMMTPEEISSASAANAAGAASRAAPRPVVRPPVGGPPPVTATPTPQMPAPMPARPATAKAPAKPMQPAGPDADALGRAAAAETRDVATGLADAQVLALTQGQRAQEIAAVDQQQRMARADADAATALNDVRRTGEELRQVDTEVDTGRWFSSRSVPGKIAAVLGLILGTIGNSNGENRAATLLNQLVDRDIDAQKASHELALRKGRANVEGAQTYYSLMRQKGLDDVAAGLAANVLAREKVQGDLQMALAKAGAPAAKAAYATELAKFAEGTEAKKLALGQAVKADRLKWYAAQTDRMQAEAQMAAAGAKEPGKVLPAETASSIAELPVAMRQLDALGKAFTEKGSGAMAKASSMLPDFVGRALGTDVADYNAQALGAMQAVGKIMEGGKLAAGDEDKYKRMLPRAGDADDLAKTKLATAKAFLSDLVTTRKKFLSDSGYRVPGEGAPAQAAAPQMMRLPSGEVVEVR